MEMYDLIVKQDELHQELAQLINKYSYLPACIIEPILKDYYEQVNNIKENQLKEAKEYVENREKEKNKEKEGKE